MRTIEEIIADLRHTIHWSQPNIKFNELNTLVTELETTLFPSEAIIEEPVVEEVIEETVTEGPTIEETVVEETITEEPVVAKRGAKKK
jgi:hypothetical protein